MKRTLFLIVAMCAFTLANAQTGTGWAKSNKKQNFRDSTYVAKGIGFPDGTVATTGFQSGDTVSISDVLLFNPDTDTLATKAQLRAVEPGGSSSSVNAVSRDSLYIGTDGYVHYVKSGYNLRLAIKDSTATDEYGSELVTNGTFASGSTGWMDGTGEALTITGGEAVINTSTSLFRVAFQSGVTFTNGKSYKVDFTVTNFTSGQINCSIGSGENEVNGTYHTANGNYSETLLFDKTTGSYNVTLRCNEEGGAVLHIDNISVKEEL